MNFVSFMALGIASSYHRNRYPRDMVQAIGSSYRYEGRVTPFEQGGKKVNYLDDGLFLKRVIDDAVMHTTISQNTRNKALSHLKTHESLAFWSGIATCGMGVMTACAYTTGHMNGISAAVVGAVTGSISILSFVRAGQAGVEASLWEDPIEKELEKRRSIDNNYNLIYNQKWKGLYCSKEETQSIFFKTLLHNKQSFFSAFRSYDNHKIAKMIRKQIESDSPLFSYDSITYAFSEAQAPVKLFALSDRWVDLQKNYIKFKTEYSKSLKNIESDKKAFSSASYLLQGTAHLINQKADLEEETEQKKKKARNAAIIEGLGFFAQAGIQESANYQRTVLKDEYEANLAKVLAPEMEDFYKEII